MQCFDSHIQDNLFEWHFTIRGPSGTDFEGGIYHGRIVLPPEYPLKPPSIILLTVSEDKIIFIVYISYENVFWFYYIYLQPNGRFQVSKKICLSISAHHPETWQPSWSSKYSSNFSNIVYELDKNNELLFCSAWQITWWSVTTVGLCTGKGHPISSIIYILHLIFKGP